MIQAVETQMRTWVESLGDSHLLSLYDAIPAGKRLRAKLVMLIAPNHPDAVKLASIIELIHAASLLHDDVIDEASLRRGVPSINATQGSKNAIMVGDILYSLAYTHLATLGEGIAQMIAMAVTQLSLGEMHDVAMSQTFNESQALYMEMIYKKTASLIEATTASSAMLAGLDVKSFALYGKNLGLAFQIIDDILDITSDEATLGKPVLSDYAEGKTTLPYIYAYTQTSNKARFASYCGQTLSLEAQTWLLDELKRYEGVAQSYTLAQQLSRDALQAVKGHSKLEALLETMMERAF